MKRFFHTITRSISDLEFYHQTLKTLRLQHVLLQYSIFLVVMGVVAALHWNTRVLPQLHTYLQASMTHAVATLPEEFALEWNGSELRSTPSTVILSYPEVWDERASLPEQLVIVKTGTDSPQEDALFTLTSRDLLIWQPEAQYTQPLSDVFDEHTWQITNADVATFTEEVSTPLAQATRLAAWLSPVLFIIGLFLKRSLQLLFASALLSLFSSSQNKRTAFTQSLQVLSMIFIPAEILAQAHSMFTTADYSIFSLSVLSYYLVIVWTKPQQVISR